jgi:sugar/nucleoside kinase (ribokinase family)
MAEVATEVIVAGHICLDIFPTFAADETGEKVLVPGKLVDVGPALLALGGAVANTGLALHRLGVATRLMGKVGDDLFGRAILDLVRSSGEALAQGMQVAPGEHSSYSVVISPPGMDRIFLHHPGANDTFGTEDIARAQVRHARLFHFGYPPLMRRIYQDGGASFAALLRELKEQGVITSLDMALPDPASEAGRVDWASWFARVLPFVDLFLPSVDEILSMLGRSDAHGGTQMDGPRLSELATHCLQFGAPIVVFKLGNAGLYLRTTDDEQRLREAGAGAPQEVQAWCNRELFTPCFQVQEVGTTGAGDCTIAGFLAGYLQGLSPGEVLRSAVAVGASSVEQADASSGVPSWSQVQARIHAGWEHCPVTLALPDWQEDQEQGIWRGPNEQRKAEQLRTENGQASERQV